MFHPDDVFVLEYTDNPAEAHLVGRVLTVVEGDDGSYPTQLLVERQGPHRDTLTIDQHDQAYRVKVKGHDPSGWPQVKGHDPSGWPQARSSVKFIKATRFRGSYEVYRRDTGQWIGCVRYAGAGGERDTYPGGPSKWVAFELDSQDPLPNEGCAPTREEAAGYLAGHPSHDGDPVIGEP